MTSQKRQSGQKATQEKAGRQKSPQEGRYDFEQEWSLPSLAGVRGSIQMMRSNQASPSQLSRAVVNLQRTVGNQAVAQMVQDKTKTKETVTAPAADKVEDGRQTNAFQVKHFAVPSIQRRRVPTADDLDEILTDIEGTSTDEEMEFEVVDAPNLAAHQAGLVRVLQRAADELDDDQRLEVLTNLLSGMSLSEFNALPEREQLTRLAAAMTDVNEDLELGDPSGYNVGARERPEIADEIRELVQHCNDEIFDPIASGAHDASIGQVFGSANIGRAKAKYARARRWMNILHRRRRIVTDLSGYSEEVGLGGLTGFHEQISVSADSVANPGANESIITMVHESMHAGNNDVDDRGYIDQPSFQELPEPVKLTNAAHFEVVPRRIKGAAYAFLDADGNGLEFVPAGTGARPALTDRQQAIRGASEQFREAWTTGLNLYEFFVRVHNTPREWTRLNLSAEFGAARGVHFDDCLPFWSKVLKMTVHEKTAIDPTSSDPSVQPVSAIDIALIEGVIRKLDIGMNRVPSAEADAEAYERANATAAELAAATTVEAERDLLIKLVIRTELNEVTGPVERDFRMVNTLAGNGATYADMLTRRSPADFAD